MLDSLITSKTRVKLLMRLFLHPDNQGHLRGLADEFDESTNAVRVELNRLEEASMLHSRMDGNKKLFQANHQHPLFPEIQNILKKVTGIDAITERIIRKLGGLSEVYISGDIAEGKNSTEMHLVLVGHELNPEYIQALSEKAGPYLNRKISIHLVSDKQPEWKNSWKDKLCLIWQNHI